MPDIYTVEIDGHEIELEGDRPPTEAEARAALQSYQASSGPHGLPADPAQREAIRQQNMAAQAHINTNPSTAFTDSLLDTAGRTVAGIGRGVASLVDPRTYVELASTARDVITPTPAGSQRMEARAKGLLGMIRNVASGDPDAGGEAIGQLGTALVAPRILPKVPNAMVRTGEAVEKFGAGPLAHPALRTAATIGGVSHGGVGGAALAIAPEGVQMAGRLMQRTGQMMGGKGMVLPTVPSPNAGGRLVRDPSPLRDPLAEQVAGAARPESVELQPAANTPTIQPMTNAEIDALAAKIEPSAPVAPSPNAGGRLVKNPPSAPDPLAEQVARATRPKSVELQPSPVTDLVQPMTSAEIDALAAKVEPPAPIRATRTGQKAATAVAPKPMPSHEPAAPPVVDDSALVKSELQKQLEASLASRQGGQQAGGIKPEMLRPSTSKGAKSATPGMTVDDVLAIGKDPTVTLDVLTPEEVTKIMQARAQRHAAKYEPAVSEAAAKRSVVRGAPQ